MSIAVMNRVWATSRAKGSALLLLLSIADHAHDDGDGAYPSIETLARKTRMSTRNTRMLLKKLEASGEIEVSRGAGPSGTNVYRVMMPPSDSRRGGEKISGEGGETQSLHGGENRCREGVKAGSPRTVMCGGTTKDEPHTESGSEARVCGSVFTLSKCRDYASYLRETKQGVKYPGAFAAKIYRTGQEDDNIRNWLAQRSRSDRKPLPGRQLRLEEFESLCKALSRVLNPKAMDRWFAAAQYTMGEDATLHVRLADEPARQWVLTQYTQEMKECADHIGVARVELHS